jgi:hypothetical protein
MLIQLESRSLLTGGEAPQIMAIITGFTIGSAYYGITKAHEGIDCSERPHEFTSGGFTYATIGAVISTALFNLYQYAAKPPNHTIIN